MKSKNVDLVCIYKCTYTVQSPYNTGEEYFIHFYYLFRKETERNTNKDIRLDKFKWLTKADT